VELPEDISTFSGSGIVVFGIWNTMASRAGINPVAMECAERRVLSLAVSNKK
jgi:hypothetical protein